MPEGVAVAGSVPAPAVHDSPDSKPEPSAEAPRGWTWNRGTRSWQAKIKGKILWQDDGVPAAEPAAAAAGPQEQRDPPPSWAREDVKDDKRRERQLRFEDVPQGVKDDIAGLAGMVATPILALVQQVDPYCGGALAQCFEPALDATLPLICRSSKIVKYFAEDESDWLLWGKVAMAMTPFAQAVFQHHVARSVEVVQDEQGRVTVRPRQAAGAADPHQPQPQPEYNYAA